jgi:phage tail sheath gpL-like
MAISTAVNINRVSRTLGYELQKGNFQPTSPNLPASIAIFAEANAANQSGLDTVGYQINSSREAGTRYGFGSPIHNISRILLPIYGSGVGSTPVTVYPQEEASGATSQINTITVTGTPSENTSHYLRINGRSDVDGQGYNFTVTTDDTVTTIAAKIASAINACIGSPVSATSALGVVTTTSKWKGATAAEINIEVFTDSASAGMTYAIASTTTGTGTPSITDALSQIRNIWTPFIINSYGTGKLTELETANGTPDVIPAQGKYSAEIWKPYVAFFGSKLATISGVTAITDASGRKTQVTNVLAPAPNSKGFAYEAAANVCYLWAVTSNDTPHLDISGKYYPDMPTPIDKNIGDFVESINRNSMVLKGSSTVDLSNDKYQVIDSVSTYHPDGEINPQWRWVRSLVQDWNIHFGRKILEETFVQDKSIAENDQIVSVDGVIKPKEFKQLLSSYADDLAERNLIVDAQFMKDSINVSTGELNPDRLESYFEYKRSPFARIVSTTGKAGFAFGLS